MNQTTYHALGLMSGTSLDGLDIALCEFIEHEGRWTYRILKAETLEYDEAWRSKLGNLHLSDGLTLWKTHVEYGHFLGRKANEFLENAPLRPALICSHGHTVFHRPESGITMQAGAGEAIAAVTGIAVAADFRSADVALGGQGAPLVPIGDRLLFPQYVACLNIGGFTNVSMEANGRRIAFDICPSNIVLNYLSSRLNKPFDENGKIARNGRIDSVMLKEMNELHYYKDPPPKSLGREWLQEHFMPLLRKQGAAIPDMLRTCCEHIGQQVGQALKRTGNGKILVTGGGAYNDFLLERIDAYTDQELLVPDTMTVNFKEAMIFAFLGILRRTGKINVYSSVTGAKRDHSGGSLFDIFPGEHPPGRD